MSMEVASMIRSIEEGISTGQNIYGKIKNIKIRLELI